ncbi:unnamed protein product [Ceutorhynchus assimilis]|uniref:Uncharacterized protein n=1 Tax=Ceutorhynchus assimilis TaxID=467358 RepID=A0A9N9N335_9CUCU|nr:unnamed protein product [Ceutorhynchus assimilis]
MKVFIVTIMLLNYLLLFLSVCSYPTLNEKNQEISWEAWLLVDDQNTNNRQQTSQIAPKRRITPKSVFVAPMFSPENLPPCAEGYSSDPMGRCVKIIKIDEDRHFDFLVSKLNERFGNLDYEEAFEATDEEPTRLDIPIDGDDYYDYSNDTPQFDNMAIIVTPTTREKEDVSKVAKRDDQELVTTTMATTTVVVGEDVTTTTISEDVTATTISEDVATTTTSEDVVATTTSNNEDATSITTNSDEEDVATTTISDDDVTKTTISNDDVTTTTISDVTTTEYETSTTPKVTTYHPLATTYHPYFDLGSRIKNFVKFPDDDTRPRSQHPEGNFIKFPDSGYQQESSGPRTRNVDSQTGNFVNNNEIVTPEPRFFSKPVKRQHKWSSEERHKPVVLRFPRKHFSFDLDKFKNGEFYRSLPMDDLTYLFGYKNAHNNR